AGPPAPPHVLFSAVARVPPVEGALDGSDAESGDLVTYVDRPHPVDVLHLREVGHDELLRLSDVLGGAVCIEGDGLQPPVRLLRQVGSERLCLARSHEWLATIECSSIIFGACPRGLCR